MGSSLIILNGDFSENAIYVWMRILVKKGTTVSIPITTGYTVEADASDKEEDTYFEFNLPASVTSFNGSEMFRPSHNPSAANILEIYMDISKIAAAPYFMLENNGFRKIVLFGTTDFAASSGLQGVSNLLYLDISKLNTAPLNYKPTICHKLKEADLSTPTVVEVPALSNCCMSCEKLEVLHLNHWRMTSETTAGECFKDCTGLKKVYIDDATSAARLIEILAAASGANIDGEATTYDATKGVINVVHTSN